MLCFRLLKEGVATLILIDRNAKALQALKDKLEQTAPDVDISAYKTDLASRESLSLLVDKLEHATIDVLINNAGIAPSGTFSEMSWDAVESVIETNFRALVFLTHRLLPKLLANDNAFIVNVASGAGLLAPGGMAAYAASKFGVVGFSEGLRAELVEKNIGVCAICPPFVQTNIVKNSQVTNGDLSHADKAQLEKLDKMVQQKGLRPEYVAETIVHAIKKNKNRVALGVLPKLLLVMRFIFPSLTDWVNGIIYRRLKRQGLLT